MRLSSRYNLIAFDLCHMGGSKAPFDSRRDTWVVAADVAVAHELLRLPSFSLPLESVTVPRQCTLRFSFLKNILRRSCALPPCKGEICMYPFFFLKKRLTLSNSPIGEISDHAARTSSYKSTFIYYSITNIFHHGGRY